MHFDHKIKKQNTTPERFYWCKYIYSPFSRYRLKGRTSGA